MEELKIGSDENDGGAPPPPEMREAHEDNQVHAVLETEKSMVVSMAWRNITCIECNIV